MTQTKIYKPEGRLFKSLIALRIDEDKNSFTIKIPELPHSILTKQFMKIWIYGYFVLLILFGLVGTRFGIISPEIGPYFYTVNAIYFIGFFIVTLKRKKNIENALEDVEALGTRWEYKFNTEVQGNKKDAGKSLDSVGFLRVRKSHFDEFIELVEKQDNCIPVEDVSTHVISFVHLKPEDDYKLIAGLTVNNEISILLPPYAYHPKKDIIYRRKSELEEFFNDLWDVYPSLKPERRLEEENFIYWR